MEGLLSLTCNGIRENFSIGSHGCKKRNTNLLRLLLILQHVDVDVRAKAEEARKLLGSNSKEK